MERTKKARACFCIALSAIACISCEYQFPELDNTADPGNADFSVYLNLGGAGMAGFMNGALYRSGQESSVAAILHRQFQGTGQVVFQQAIINSETGYNEFIQEGPAISGRFVYRFVSSADTPEITILEGTPVEPYTADRNMVTDLAVPFLKTIDLSDPELPSRNVYFNRFSSSPGTRTLLQQATGLNPTFFTLWLGMADVFNYARTGALADPLPEPGSVGFYDMVRAEDFENSLDIALEQLLSDSNVKGVIANIPDLKDLPYFFLYHYKFMRLTNSALRTAQNTLYAEFNDAVALHNVIPDAELRPYISLDDNGLAFLSPQAIVVLDTSLTDAYYPDGRPLPKIRQLQAGEMVLMSVPVKDMPSGLGWLDPLPPQYYLSIYQVSEIQARINAFNQIILQAVNRYPGRLALADVKALYTRLAPASRSNAFNVPESDQPVLYNGVPVMFDLSLNSAISLDGLHPNPRGSALIANLFIEAMNRDFGATIPTVDINLYTGNTVLFE